MKAILKNQKGLTLLEFLIAFAILTIVLTSVYIAQSSSLFSSIRTKNLVIATNLARSFLVQSENDLTGLKFENLSKEETGEFPEPNKKFTWKRTIEEVDFAALTQLITAKLQEKNKLDGVKSEENLLLKGFEDYLKKSVRKMVITIEWPEGEGKSHLSFTQLLVNYDADFTAGGI